AAALHSRCGAARYVRSLIPGALSILKGAVPDRARGLGHMAPTYFRREPGIATPTAERLRTHAFQTPCFPKSSWPGIAVRRTASLRSPMSRPSHVLKGRDVDARNKRGHDGVR